MICLKKIKRNIKLHHVRKNKKKLGRSIEERPKEIDQRNEFGHWECDLVLGHKTKDDRVLLTLSERMSREFLIIRIPDKTSVSVMQAFKMLQKQYSEHWNDIFKTRNPAPERPPDDASPPERHPPVLLRHAGAQA